MDEGSSDLSGELTEVFPVNHPINDAKKQSKSGVGSGCSRPLIFCLGLSAGYKNSVALKKIEQTP